MWANLTLGLVFAAGLTAAAGGLYFEGKRAGRNEQIAKQATIDQMAAAFEQKTAGIVAKAISGIKVQNRTVYQEVQREVLERPVYRECEHSPDVLRRINAALTGQPAEPAGRGLVPPADAAGGLQLRRDDAEADRGGGAVPGMPGGGDR